MESTCSTQRRDLRPLAPPCAMVQRKCSTPGCSVELKVRETSTVATCPKCFLAQEQEWQKAEAERVRKDLPARLPRILRRRGMDPDHLAAKLDQVDPSLMELVRPLLHGLMGNLERPASGWGMTGDTGTGKSHLAAAVVKAWTWKAANWRLDTSRVLGGAWPLWASWAGTLDELRGAMRERSNRYGDLMDDLRECPLLVLDDLGAERAQEAEGSWVVERLYDVLESRYSNGRATLWTSNLSVPALTDRYERRIVSRLIGLARPLTMPEGLKDRRLAGR